MSHHYTMGKWELQEGNQKNMTGYALEKIYFKHNPGYKHPESPERLKAVEKVLKSCKGLKKVPARSASKDEICLVHTPLHYEKIKATQGNRLVFFDPDTGTSEKSFESAIYAVGGVLDLIDSVFKGKIENGFAFVRPPGHHAEIDKAMGFCLFNNIAVGAAYALDKYNLNKVLIIDIDLHHGNGTQNAFYKTRNVMYISTHEFPHYPGTGDLDETGEGKGKGYNLNFPLTSGTDDSFYDSLFKKIIIPIGRQFTPELILVSCGFDAHYKDHLGGLNLTGTGYAGITRQIRELAEEVCKGRLIYSLEGGYSPEGIKDGTKSVLNELTKRSKEIFSFHSRDDFKRYYDKIKIFYGKYWDF